jgi:hypothetical protein
MFKTNGDYITSKYPDYTWVVSPTLLPDAQGRRQYYVEPKGVITNLAFDYRFWVAPFNEEECKEQLEKREED